MQRAKTLLKVLAVIVGVTLLIGGACYYWWLERHPFMREQLAYLFDCIFCGADKKTTDNFKKLAEEFSVGKPSAQFIKRAREIGADEYAVHVPKMGKRNSKAFAKSTAEESSWFVSKLQFELGNREGYKLRDREYEESLNRLEARFRSLPEGSASIQVTVVPPFLRDNCQIWFKDGKVTKIRVWQLD